MKKIEDEIEDALSLAQEILNFYKVDTMNKTCCATPPTPEQYQECLKKDIMQVFENACIKLAKCEAQSAEYDFYYSIIQNYDTYNDNL